MKSLLGSIPAIALLLLIRMTLHAGQIAVLSDVQLTTRSGHSTVTFAFEGDISFSSSQRKGGVRLIFSRTRPATPRLLQRRLIPAGPVESIACTRSTSDSLVFDLALAKGSSYLCVRPVGRKELVVDVDGPAGVRHSPPPASGQPLAGAGSHQSKSTSRNTAAAQLIRTGIETQTPKPIASQLVDIPAIARLQMEGENGTSVVRERPEPKQSDPAGLSTSVVLMLSAGLSLGSTGILLWLWHLIRRRASNRARNRSFPSAEHADRAASATSNPVAAGNVDEETEPEGGYRLASALGPEDDGEEASSRESSLQLARTFKRGSEEISLAQRFHGHTVPAVSAGKVQATLSRATTPTQRLQAARKLGVGRGEFDLALKLKTMAQVEAGKEEYR